MKTAAIFSLLPVKPESTIASVRIARWLSDQLGVELFDGPQIADKELDVLFIVNASTLFCKHLPEVAQAVARAKEVVWVQNDYTLPPPKADSDAESPFRAAFNRRKLTPHFWTTCGENVGRTEKSARMNWNCLGMDLTQKPAELDTASWFYYGAHRDGRASSFKYVDSILPSWNISTTSAKFADYPHANLLDSMPRSKFFDGLRGHGMGLYMQDAKSASKDHQPATRFYEMLSVGLPMAFTPDCVPTLAQYGIDVRPFIVSPGMLSKRAYTAAQQKTLWYHDYVALLSSTVKGEAHALLS